MSLVTVYATGVFKRNDSIGYYGYACWKKNARNPKEKVADYACESKLQLQLTALIQGISTAKDINGCDELKVITDFSLISHFLDCSVIDWERNNWVKENGKPVPEAELWKELNDLSMEYNILFEAPKENDEKMAEVTKKMKSKSRKGNKPPAKMDRPPKSVGRPAKKSSPAPEAAPVIEPIPDQVAEEVTSFNMDSRLKAATTSSDKVEEILSSTAPGNIRVESSLKQASEELFQELGLDLDTAVTLFLKDSLRKKGLSLDLRLNP